MSEREGCVFLTCKFPQDPFATKKQTRDPSLLNLKLFIGGLAPKPRDLVSDQGPLSGVMLRVGNGKTASKVVLGVNSIPIRCIFDVFITAALYSCPPPWKHRIIFSGSHFYAGSKQTAASAASAATATKATPRCHTNLSLLLDLLVQ